MKQPIHLIECPRDAMQGWKTFIPTVKKIEYINSLLKVGFHTLDFGSFVSAKAIPQMQDTKEVIKGLDVTGTNSKLLAIVANTRGAEEASEYEQITSVGFPFSISETFQQRNTNGSITEALKRVTEISEICIRSGKELVIYISMAFGNPYGEAYSEELVSDYVHKIVADNPVIISLADTVGLATPQQVQNMTSYLLSALPHIEMGVHLHSTYKNWEAKIEAASRAGCTRFDGALKGIGGCPIANDELVGNMNMEWMIDYFEKNNLSPGLDAPALQHSLILADAIFSPS